MPNVVVQILEGKARALNQLGFRAFRNAFFGKSRVPKFLAVEFYEDYVSSQMAIESFIKRENY